MKGKKRIEDFSVNHDLLTKHLNSFNHLAMTAYYLKTAIGGCTNTGSSNSVFRKLLNAKLADQLPDMD